VNVSTLSRAIKEERLPAPVRQPREAAAYTTEHESFLGWARATYDLSRAEDELAQLAQSALDLARNTETSAAVRLQAMAQYRAALRDLRLPTEE